MVSRPSLLPTGACHAPVPAQKGKPLPQEAFPLGEPTGTLQPKAESVIEGYDAFAKASRHPEPGDKKGATWRETTA